jgi:DNA-binding transcriptional LysR family regulator
MYPNISLTQMRCFQAVAELGGFTAAADGLCLSQSAVSQAVAALEKQIGARLLVRGRDRVTLTVAGQAALAETRLALAAVERLAHCGQGARVLTGSVRLVQSAAIQLLPGWVRQLRAAHPRVTVTLYEGTDPEVTGWLLAGVVDLGITSRLHPDLTARPIFEDEYLVVLPPDHPFVDRPVLDLAMLTGERMLLSGGGCETLIQELLGAADSRPEIVAMVRDNATLLSMVRAGLGLTIMPELAVASDRAGVVCRGLRPALPRRLHLLSRGEAELGPVAGALLQIIQGAAPMRQAAE